MKKILTSVLASFMMVLTASLFNCCCKDDDSNSDNVIGTVTISPDYVPIDWENATVTTSDDVMGTYQILFSDSVPDIHPGSIIAIDRDTLVMYRFVTSANVDGKSLNISTTEAFLTDIFYDTEVTFTTANTGSKSSEKGAIVYPVAAYIMDKDGTCHSLCLKRKGETHFTHDLWHYGFNHDGMVLHAGSYDSIVMDQMNLDLDLDFEMYMNFSGRDYHEVVNDAIDRYTSRALKFNTAVIGDFKTEQQIRCKSWGNSHIQTPVMTIVPRLFPLAVIRFMAGPVPVIIKVQVDLCGQAEVSTTNVIEAYTGFSSYAKGRIGFKWSQAGGMVPEQSLESTFNSIPPTLEGRGEIQTKVWAFPRINFYLYNIVGPTLDFMPYERREVRGGYREQMLGQSNDYCAWTYDYHAGLDFCSALNFNIMGHGFVSDVLGGLADVHSPVVNITDRLLYHSPSRVVHASGQPRSGYAGTVSFNVYDNDYLRNAETLTTLPQIVKFEADGQLSSEYGIVRNGTVSVNWRPTRNGVLYAKLYDIYGNVISMDMVMCENGEEPEPVFPTSNWVDLGLPSGLLWASRNVGASAITDYGNYYAWGETSPKNVYDLATYQHFSHGENGWIIRKYNSIDSLTILEPCDDAATVNYGGHMPTKEQWDELLQFTSQRRYTLNGVQGLCITGANGNSIFLPAAGCYSSEGLIHIGYGFEYWSSTLHESVVNAWHMYVFSNSDNVNMSQLSRTSGLSVRAVRFLNE